MEKIQVTKDRYRSYRFRGVTRSNFTPSKNSLEYYFAIKKPELRDSLFLRVKGKVGNMCWPHCRGYSIFLLNMAFSSLSEVENIYIS